ncbi:hypothetical protein Tco_1031042, partial [Tanacetum coccineum]
IQQRGPNRGRRRAEDKYRFNSREVRTEVDKEHIRQMHSTESYKYGDEREHTRHVHSTEAHKYGDEREQIRQTAADNSISRQTTKNSDRQQTTYTDNRFRQSKQINKQIPN